MLILLFARNNDDIPLCIPLRVIRTSPDTSYGDSHSETMEFIYALGMHDWDSLSESPRQDSYHRDHRGGMVLIDANSVQYDDCVYLHMASNTVTHVVV